MSQYPTPGGGPNQTLIELILALKGLAQTFDLAHSNIKNLVEAEAKANAREFDRIRDLIAKSNQSLTVLPITVSDRVERLIDNLEKDMDEKVQAMIREVSVSVQQVQEKFIQYIQAKGEPVPEELLDGPRQVTGRIQLREDGTMDVRIQTAWAQKAIAGLKWSAIGGGTYGLVELLRAIFKF